MSPSRMRMMIEDMKLAGLSPGTQAIYIDVVRKLAAPALTGSTERGRGARASPARAGASEGHTPPIPRSLVAVHLKGR
jgi:hypothetical protein